MATYAVLVIEGNHVQLLDLACELGLVNATEEDAALAVDVVEVQREGGRVNLTLGGELLDKNVVLLLKVALVGKEFAAGESQTHYAIDSLRTMVTVRTHTVLGSETTHPVE